MDKMRIDKWLWAARFFKTRSLATEAVQRGHVKVDGKDVKPSREIRANEKLDVWQGQIRKTLIVRGLSEQRGSATIAQALFEETAQSVADRLQASEQRRLSPEPAHSIAQGRPTKRDRRALQNTPWDDRWTASIDS